ncbi:MAG: hypothetical protein IPQ04_07995 [Saprospiraceae bacterium]|nr:hypothetical protein [Saprospiraceae bacterium]
MKKSLAMLCLLFLTTYSQAQEINPAYDATLATSLGGDEHGMKSYFLVILKTGKKEIKDAKKKAEIFKGHMDNIQQMVADKKLVVAGPFGKNDMKYRGIFILDLPTEAEARILVERDPVIISKLMKYDILPWYGSAALPTYLPYSDKIWKTKH